MKNIFLSSLLVCSVSTSFSMDPRDLQQKEVGGKSRDQVGAELAQAKANAHQHAREMARNYLSKKNPTKADAEAYMAAEINAGTRIFFAGGSYDVIALANFLAEENRN